MELDEAQQNLDILVSVDELHKTMTDTTREEGYVQDHGVPNYGLKWQ